jgi:hypothetical protein
MRRTRQRVDGPAYRAELIAAGRLRPDSPVPSPTIGTGLRLDGIARVLIPWHMRQTPEQHEIDLFGRVRAETFEHDNRLGV